MRSGQIGDSKQIRLGTESEFLSPNCQQPITTTKRCSPSPARQRSPSPAPASRASRRGRAARRWWPSPRPSPSSTRRRRSMAPWPETRRAAPMPHRSSWDEGEGSDLKLAAAAGRAVWHSAWRLRPDACALPARRADPLSGGRAPPVRRALTRCSSRTWCPSSGRARRS